MKMRNGMMFLLGSLAIGCGIDHSAFNSTPDAGMPPMVGQHCGGGVVQGCNTGCPGSYFACVGGTWDCIYNPTCSPPSTTPADAGMADVSDAAVVTDVTPVDRPSPPVDVMTCADRRAGQPCTNGTGQCARPGHFTCTPGGGAVCDSIPGFPSAEICDGIDNDCNGLIDEMAPATCYDGPMRTFGVGACRPGRRTCRGTAGWSMDCMGQTLPSAEIPGNAVDEDCDGYAAPATTGTCAGSTILGMACERGLGRCRVTSRWTCIDGTRVDCPVVPPAPQQEICDGIDNNCDGEIDNGCVTGPDAGVHD